MGLFDLSVPELKEYKGRNPRPDDFDLYWDRAIDEMRAINPAPTLKKAFRNPTFDCFELTFTSVGGARIYAKYVCPKDKRQLPVVLHFHGYTGASPEWSELFQLASMGWAVAAMDVRGQGGKSMDNGSVRGNTLHGHIIRGLDEESPDQLLFRNIFLDTAMLARVVSTFPETDETRMAAIGGSQGGGLSLACAALADIKLCAPHYPFLSDYQRVWELDLATEAYAELQEYFRHFDPTHSREKEIFTKLGYIDIEFLMPRVKAQVRMYTGLMDTICPPSTQFAAFNKITSPKSVIFYPDIAHEYLPGAMDDTISWFLYEL